MELATCLHGYEDVIDCHFGMEDSYGVIITCVSGDWRTMATNNEQHYKVTKHDNSLVFTKPPSTMTHVHCPTARVQLTYLYANCDPHSLQGLTSRHGSPSRDEPWRAANQHLYGE